MNHFVVDKNVLFVSIRRPLLNPPLERDLMFEYKIFKLEFKKAVRTVEAANIKPTLHNSIKCFFRGKHNDVMPKTISRFLLRLITVPKLTKQFVRVLAVSWNIITDVTHTT